MQSENTLRDRIAEREGATRLLRRWTIGLVVGGTGLVAALSFVAASTFAGHQQVASADQQPAASSNPQQQAPQFQSPGSGFFGNGGGGGFGGGSGGGVVTGGS
ncbi:MAG TPA: hypothetical protein VNG93_02080 [Candidatus Dormibacteraeota bacterium]|nr:hypothetical protein [Candidatus Dormibacteraeota bacterium]